VTPFTELASLTKMAHLKLIDDLVVENVMFITMEISQLCCFKITLVTGIPDSLMFGYFMNIYNILS
jgi:hypothetical protein